MTTPAPRLELQLDGPAVPGRISVDALAFVSTQLQSTLRRIVSQRPSGSGRFGKQAEQACSLDLVAFRPGSANLVFELAGQRETSNLYGDPGIQAIEEFLDLGEKAENGDPGWQQGILPGVQQSLLFNAPDDIY